MRAVAIVGGGFSGTALAVELARRGVVRPTLIERRPEAGPGLAYGTMHDEHRLNVPAGRMSACPEDPDHFVRWLRGRLVEARRTTFAPRRLYGSYLRELLDQAGGGVERLRDQVVAARRTASGFELSLGREEPLEARAVVLATGHLPPPLPDALAPLAGRPVLVRDPWAEDALERLPLRGPVVLVGTGLTMVDVALTLRARGARGPVLALSRHGLLPRSHGAWPAGGIAPRLPEPPTIRGILRALREAAHASHLTGDDWRGAVDALRRRTPALWRALPLAERRRFLRHARAHWSVHRHRMEPAVAAEVTRLLGRGWLRPLAARIVAATPLREGAELVIRRRGERVLERVQADAVCLCLGPAPPVGPRAPPLVRSLREQGLLDEDPLGLGLATAPDGAVIGRGAPVEGLWAIGPLRVPERWESHDVPELRAQVAELAARLSEEEASRGATAP